MNEQMKAYFGTLRSLLNIPKWYNSEKREFRQVLRDAYALDSEVYQSQWLPYIDGYKSRFKDNRWEIMMDQGDITLEAFELCGLVEPFLRFRVSIYANTSYKIKLVEQLLNSKYAGIIEQLSLASESNVSAQLAQVLADATSKTSISSLNLRCCYFGDDGFAKIINANVFCGVDSLDVSANDLSDRGIESLAKIPLPLLTYFNVNLNQFGADGLRAVAQMSLPVLSHFSADGNLIGDEGLAYLSQSLWAKGLEYLVLNDCDFGDDGAVALSDVSFTKLRCLYISRNHISARGFKAMVMSTKLDSIQSLHVEQNQIGDEGAAIFGLGCVWTQLTDLNVGENNIGDEGIKQFIQAPILARLEKLQIYTNQITPVGINYMLHAKYFGALKFLSLFHNKLNEQDVVCLKQSSNFPVLGEVRM